ncbi:P-loop containing nucleoside triphosphate hydrolase protein [Amniculicola lignicola CBS 123094]|uniref:P-loop containing nucleoside triphosphate hydrolase protein n=1 Tax=Amniculicola lignicola CBS 123094 TaxID=1392246 RepID=A0A6A5WKA7_9PLEO|nr:P-loop containing nucleoside triphosphate hydrolase protein [Amniculicola lignicola CBS 123094]
MSTDTQVISVLGGPGAGKGTQCSLLQKTFRCAHFSVGDLLRAEAAKPNSPYRDIIQENMTMGRVGPKEITVDILRKNIQEATGSCAQTILLDGFPRKMDQANYFEETIGTIAIVLVFECPEEILVDRLLQRKRNDDDVETIRRRVRTFNTTTAEVLAKYEALGKVVRIDVVASVEDVFLRVQTALHKADICLDKRPGIDIDAY